MKTSPVTLMARMGLIVVAFAIVHTFIPGRGACSAEDKQSWVDVMKDVHSRFRGRKGTFAHFGDSITITMAFWSPLPGSRKNASKEMEDAFKRVNDYMRPECWREWKGPEFGNEGGKTIKWAQKNLDAWLKDLNPEVALIMFGSNDVHYLDLPEYRKLLEAVVAKCLQNGTIVILSTPPPQHGMEQKVAAFSDAVREVARAMNVPLLDYHAEILKRRPEDWDGTLDKFKEFEGYDVPTLVSRDGVHPSYPKQFKDDYSEEGLSKSGYTLRSYLVLMKYAEILDALKLSGSDNLLRQAWFPEAPPLPPPSGEVLRVQSVNELVSASDRVRPGGTILLADGHYALSRRLEIKTDRVTLRSASGRRDRVIIDGAPNGLRELIAISHCSDVTIADLTIQNVTWNGFKINSETGVQRLTIYNCVIHNIWQRGVKGVRVPEKEYESMRPKACRISYCLFYNDRKKSYEDDPADTAENFQGDYIGGIDIMAAKDWQITDNVFVGIQGRTRQGRAAIFVWVDSEGCLIERNVMIDCDVGISLGNSYRHPGIVDHCTGFIVRNNFITRCPESGILAAYTKDCKIVHNTIHDPTNLLGRLIRLVFDNEGLLVANNLLSGPPVKNESNSKMTLKDNFVSDSTKWFVDSTSGNLHLLPIARGAINRGERISDTHIDIDGEMRDAKPDIGADEVVSQSSH